jgi:CRISPR-associated endonuclease/helicase Cas3
LEKTARLARAHSAAFGSAEWGELAGWWHDLWNYQPAFQARLRGSHEQVEQAGGSEVLASGRGKTALPLAFAVARHHAGLANLDVQGDMPYS